ncbi:MAG TPA: hypothetical protein VNM92_11480 [Thermoanaerobaculia bacterium]|nr:hypothetical protein [Thermoanaerobaculia bacterium]
MSSPDYAFSVFINCPFDDSYRPLLQAIVFVVHDCGYIARSAQEVYDSSDVRIEKISRIIEACRLGVHDVSQTDLDPANRLPRFNMPLELGMFLGAKRFGSGKHKTKLCLVLDTEKYRYQKFISDISGQDIAAHSDRPAQAIKVVRDFISGATPKTIQIPGCAEIGQRYKLFRRELPLMCKRLRLKENDLTFGDYVVHVEEWLKLNVVIAG